MPILPENRARYPRNWKSEIRPAVIERAGNRCEGSPDYPDCRAENHQPHPDTGSHVVLTIGHLDHVPENCAMDNLRAWCQRCHMHYDRHHHANTRRSRKAIGDLYQQSSAQGGGDA